MKKKFENPTLTIVLFTNDDIITSSGELQGIPGNWTDDPEDDGE